MVVVAPADSQVFRIPVEDGEFVLPRHTADHAGRSARHVGAVRPARGPAARPEGRVESTCGFLRSATGPCALEVRVIGSKGEYTGWRATRASGDFDLRTFEIRAYPVQPVEGLRPGMSVYTDAWHVRRATPAT